jgi:polyhydroxybutyrate depolymerase
MRCVGLLIALFLPVAAYAQRDEVRSVFWQGIERHYTLHLAGLSLPAAAPLVVALAGLGQDLNSLRRWLQLDPVADQHRFVVAYPEAIDEKWSYWHGGGILVPDHSTEDVDDVGFITAVVGALVSEGTVDPSRAYLTGISRGALMSWTLACERADLFDAIAPISSAMTAWQTSNCHPSRPVPIIAVDGTDDPIQPYDGLTSPPPIPRLTSVPETIAFWRRLNGCTDLTEKPLPHRDHEDRTRINLYEWTECAGGGPVMLYRVDGGGHPPPTLATVDPPSPEQFGLRSSDMETAQEIWNVFTTIKPLKAP